MTPVWPFTKAGALLPGRTPQDAVDYMTTAPEWRFATDPNNAVTHAINSAANAATGVSVLPRDDTQARFWTCVAEGLIAAADNPYITGGAVLAGLVQRYPS